MYDVGLYSIMKHYTFVMDCEATMPCIVGASASTRIISLSDTWMGCVSHQLSTVRKNSIRSTANYLPHETGATIKKDVDCVKRIVTDFKHTDLNMKLPEGFSLIKEVQTRFGTTHDVIKRFIKSAHLFPRILESINRPEAFNSFTSISRDADVNRKV